MSERKEVRHPASKLPFVALSFCSMARGEGNDHALAWWDHSFPLKSFVDLALMHPTSHARSIDEVV